MKLAILLTSIFLTCSSAFAGTFIDCEGDKFSGARLNSEDLTTFRGTVSLIFNFASANLSCSSSMDQALKEGKTFRCAGVWGFDLRREDDTEGTVVVVEFSQKEDKAWVADFITSYDYGREQVQMNCSLRDGE